MTEQQTGQRPPWASSFYLWLTDGQYDATGDGTDWHYTWRGWVETIGVKLLCVRFGHKPVSDQCNRPEHDLCVFCNKSMPFMARRESA